ncbi:MAG: tRNA lysidine(34) synthetase TilS [Rikenellaceae bacterium]|nr:tRNA lysidine(34) synthetase TilS [Rikenellaceae bacterium]
MKQRNMVAHGRRTLLAVSGGVDSMVMLRLFVESGYDIAVAHCNFRLRGEESDGDERLVESECRRLGVELFVKCFDVHGEMAASGDSLQASARALRYAWFEKLCCEHGFAVVAVAHNADDSTETFFINLLRGTGLKGLTGIPLTRDRIIRPLLFATREMIAHYAAREGVSFREDSSNRTTKYLRNRLRHTVLPRLCEIEPEFPRIMTANLGRLAATERFVERSLDIVHAQVTRCDKQRGTVTVDTAAIDPSLPLDFVLFGLLGRYGFGADVVEQLVRALADGATGRRFHAPARVAWIDRRRIVMSERTEHDDNGHASGHWTAIDLKELVIEEFTPTVEWGGVTLCFELVPAGSLEDLRQPPSVALLDADKVHFPLVIRRWHEGDAFVPLGMKGRKKLSDLMIDTKASMLDKLYQGVLLSGGEIAWVIGRRSAEDFRITQNTKTVLKVCLKSGHQNSYVPLP